MFGQLVVVGNVTLEERSAQGEPLGAWRFPNTVTSGGLAYLRDMLVAATQLEMPLPPSFIAFGSGFNGSPGAGIGRFSTRIPGETARTAIVQRDRAGAASVIFHAFLGPTDNQNQTMAVVGLYAGTATEAPNSGDLLACAAIAGGPVNKNPQNSYHLDWNLTISGKFT